MDRRGCPAPGRDTASCDQLRAADRSRSKVSSRPAATLTAIVAGSLPVVSANPMGVRIRAIVDGSWPPSASIRWNRAHFPAEPISPIEPRSPPRRMASHSAASSAWSWVMISTWVPGGSSPRTISGSSGTRWTWRFATASDSGASRSSVSCSGRLSTRCSWRSCRTRMRASSNPTWPTPKMATAGTTGSGSSSTVTVPPQHWTPCSTGALSDSAVSNSTGFAPGSASSSRARSTATASTLPPPIDPHVSRTPTTSLAPASRGACPRTDATVTSTPGSRRARRRATALNQVVSGMGDGVLCPLGLGLAPVRVGRLGRDDVGVGDMAVRSVLPRLLDGPVDGLRGRGAAEVDARPRRPERGRGLPQRLPHREGQHQRRFPDGLGPVDRALLGRVLEQGHVEDLGHLREAGQLVGAGRLGQELAAPGAVTGVPAQVLEGEPAGPLHEGALDLAEVHQGREAVTDVVDDVDAPRAVGAGEAVDLDLGGGGPVGEVLERRPPHHRRVPVKPLGAVVPRRPQLDPLEIGGPD